MNMTISKTGTSTRIKIGECELGSKDGGMEIFAELLEMNVWCVRYTLNLKGNIFHKQMPKRYTSEREAICETVKHLDKLFASVKDGEYKTCGLLYSGVSKLKALYPPRHMSLFSDEVMHKMTRKKDLIDYI